MKAVIRGFGLALLATCFVGLSGCGTDNESEAVKAQANLGAAPTPAGKGGDAPPAPATYAERKAPALDPGLQQQGKKK